MKSKTLSSVRGYPARFIIVLAISACILILGVGNTLAANSLRDRLGGSRTVKLDNNVKLYDGWTELMYASWRGNLKAVTELLEKSSGSVDEQDEDKRTAMTYAAWHGNSAIIRLLHQNGADINHRDVDDMTPLMWAARNGQRDAANTLLSLGASINFRDKSGKTAVIWAARMGHERVA
ncbi:MAG: ankyrin repeat domain-containing protein, partial [Gammaproteobacteria bacterium]